jgi:hypothetical protein
MGDVRTDEAAVPHDAARWLVKTEIAKFDGDWTPEQIDAGEAPKPFEVVKDEGNLLLIGGVSLLWELATGNRAAGEGHEGDGRDLPAAHGLDGHLHLEDDHVPVDLRERRREPGVGGVGDRQRHAAAEPEGGGERHEGQRADVAVHRDRDDRLVAWHGSTSLRRTRPPGR